jgi:translation initiation factor 2B subunit (eIF-2B alpha/beta/delta family)
MPTDLDDLASKVREDSVSGSSEIAFYVLERLHDVLSKTGIDREQLLNFSDLLRKAKPAMAPMYNVARMLETAANSPEPEKAALLAVERVISTEKMVPARITEKALERIEGTVLTLSYSGTVVSVLKAVAKEKEIRVIVAESLPRGEGRKTAELLTKVGIETVLITDSMVFSEARNSDLCLVGADAITPEALINKVGTYGMTLASVQAGIPAYIISSTLKITSELKPDWIIKENTKGKLTERTQLFEPVPLELFAEAFTELGSSKPTRLFRMR